MRGVIYAFLAAVGYAIYQCLLSYAVGDEKAQNPVSFCLNFGFAVSLTHLILILPIVLLLSEAEVESLVLPGFSLLQILLVSLSAVFGIRGMSR